MNQYVGELKQKSKIVLLVFTITFVLSVLLSSFVFNLITTSTQIENFQVVLNTPFEVFSITLLFSSLTSIVVTIPFILLQFYNFSKNALTIKEQKVLRALAPLSAILFAIGGILSFYLVTQIGIPFLTTITPFQILWNASNLLTSIFWFTFVGGLMFQIPVVLSALNDLKLVNKAQLVQNRKFIWGGILILSAIITPTGDIITLTLFSTPLVVLFEGTLNLIKEV